MLDYYESIITKLNQLLFIDIHNIHNKEEFRVELTRLYIRKTKIEHKLTEIQHWGFHEMLAALVEYRYKLHNDEVAFYDDVVLSGRFIPIWVLERLYK